MVWNGARDDYGYGHIYVPGAQVVRSVHRVSYELVNGPGRMESLHVCHACDNPPCWEPSHLFLGTPADNARDRAAKGRGVQPRMPGEANPLAKLTAMQVAEIRHRHAVAAEGRKYAKGDTQAALAAEFGVHHSTIGEILRGENWRG